MAPGNRIIAIRHFGSNLENVLGPGNLIPLSQYWSNPPAVNSVYYQLSGTSMAAAVVSGAAALLIQKDPTLTPDTIKARLMKTARKSWNGNGLTPDVYSRGAGYLNTPAALACTDKVTSPALSPLVTNINGVIALANAVWCDNALWGEHAVWSDVDTLAVNGE